MKARTTGPTDELRRAQLAHAHVNSLPEPGFKKYRSIALKLPVLVQREGLAVALHFVAARGEADQKPILDHLAAQLGQQDRAALLAWSIGLGEAEGRRATEEVQRTLAWYKRLVQARSASMQARSAS
jgi:CRISPR/Cas system CMR-associated protein Cmr5 small subunit